MTTKNRRRVVVPPTRGQEEDGLLADIMAGRPVGGDVAVRPPAPAVRFDPGVLDGEKQEDRLARLELVVTSAQNVATETVKRARNRFILEGGAALAAIHGEELWKLTHPTFEAYVEAKWGYSRAYAYQIMNAVPVVAAVSAIADVEINAEHVKVLVPVINSHGDEAARQVWAKARTDIEGKQVTGAALRAARRALGFAPDDELLVPQVRAEQDMPAPLASLGQAVNGLGAVRRLLNKNVVRSALELEPDAATALLDELERTIETIRRVSRRP